MVTTKLPSAGMIRINNIQPQSHLVVWLYPEESSQPAASRQRPWLEAAEDPLKPESDRPRDLSILKKLRENVIYLVKSWVKFCLWQDVQT